MKRRETRHPSITCPLCGATRETSYAHDGSDVVPSPGDLSVCRYCCAVMIFDDEMRPRPLTQAETMDLLTTPDMVETLAEAVRHVQELNLAMDRAN
jgi:hypothetical protein